jgi:hypothetical protein
LNEPNKYITEDRISFRDVIAKFARLGTHLRHHWRVIAIGSVLITGLRISYHLLTDPIYTAETTFIVDAGGGGGGMGQIGSLASIVGVNLNSISDDSQLFDTDHIVELYLSYNMLKKAFLSYTDDRHQERLITRYAREKKILKKWNKKDELKDLSFEITEGAMGIKHDSLLMEVIKDFKENQLSVGKPDRKLMILKVTVADKDPVFAKRFNEVLVSIVNNFYETTSTKKTGENLQILQTQADSARFVLDNSLDKLAKLSELQPNPNPLYFSSQVPYQKLQIDIEASAAVYEEIVKNLEMAKVSHRNKKPLIQVIDTPVLPLKIDKERPLKLIVISSIIAGMLMTLFIIIRYVWKELLQESD